MIKTKIFQDHIGHNECALHKAATICSPTVLEVLLEYRADPNVKEGQHSRTALHILAINWSHEKDSAQWTTARENEYKLFLDKLLSLKRTKIDALDNKKWPPIAIAAKQGLEYMTKQLVLKGANLEIAVRSKTVKEIVLDKFPQLFDGIDFSKIQKPQINLSEDLFDAVTSNNIEDLKDIIEKFNGLDEESKKQALNENHGRYTPLQYACHNGYESVVDELLNAGADPVLKNETTSYSPVIYACMSGYYYILEKLIEKMKGKKQLEKGVLNNADGKGETPLHKVVKREGITEKY